MQSYKAYAKVNIFLKITGTRGNYHEIISRFMRVEGLYDTLSFVPKQEVSNDFEIVGSFTCTTQQNTIYKAYKALCEKLEDATPLKNHMRNYAIKVEKKIPAFAGLGGGSSDAATFLHMCNDLLSLDLSVDELAEVGLHVGADVPFFVYGYKSANVSGIGEIVEPFEEELLAIETYTPKVEISTPKVYSIYRKDFFHPIDEVTTQKLKNTSSAEVLAHYSAQEANDLFAPALQGYPELKQYYKEGYFFSGSGSSFFKVKGK